MDPATLIITALAVAAFGTGGEVTSSTTTTTAPPTRLEEPLTLVVSGAEVGGADERVRIAPSGEAWFQTGDGDRQGYELTRRELNSVAAVADLAFMQGSRQLPVRCLDCSLYEIRFAGERLTLDAAGLDRAPIARRLVTTIARSVPEEMTR